MNFERVADMVAELAMLKFFPSDDNARDGIVRLIGKICRDEPDVRWLIDRMLAIYNEWPGPQEMRACYSNRKKPADGIEAYSAVFLDGFPVDPTVTLPALPLPPPQLTSGDAASDSPSLSATVADLARAKDLNRTLNRIAPPKVAEIPVVRITDANRITPEMIEKAQREYRESKARKEAEGPDKTEKDVA